MSRTSDVKMMKTHQKKGPTMEPTSKKTNPQIDANKFEKREVCLVKPGGPRRPGGKTESTR